MPFGGPEWPFGVPEGLLETLEGLVKALEGLLKAPESLPQAPKCLEENEEGNFHFQFFIRFSHSFFHIFLRPREVCHKNFWRF